MNSKIFNCSKGMLVFQIISQQNLIEKILTRWQYASHSHCNKLREVVYLSVNKHFDDSCVKNNSKILLQNYLL